MLNIYSTFLLPCLIFNIKSNSTLGVGVIHCDMKPENLMLCSRNRRGGTIKIIDFGCAIVKPTNGIDEDYEDIPETNGKKDATVPENGTTG
jgi:serine/threonine protein kinase